MDKAYGGFAQVYDRLMSDVDYDAWAEYIDALLGREMPGHFPLTLHECACGTGSITTRLAKHGYLISASDASCDMLGVAREKTMRAGQRIPLIAQDMRNLSLHHPVDGILTACDGVNYLLDADDLNAFFSAAHGALAPGGLLLFDCSTEYKLKDVIGYSTFGEDDGEIAYLWRNAYDDKSRLSEMNLSFFVREGQAYRRFTERHVQKAHRTKELCTLLEKNGFYDVRSYDAFTFLPETARSERIQYSARRI